MPWRWLSKEMMGSTDRSCPASLGVGIWFLQVEVMSPPSYTQGTAHQSEGKGGQAGAL